MTFNERIDRKLSQVKKANRYRKRVPSYIQNSGRTISINQRSYLNFAGNDYLGLSQSKVGISAFKEGLSLYGIGSTGSGHITGYSQALHQLENELAEWLGYEKAIVFTSGYSANQAVIKALINKKDAFIADRLSHASMLEAAQFSPGKLLRFSHNSKEALKRCLDKADAHNFHNLLVATEGIFSMDGDEAPLVEFSAILKNRENSWFFVDDAHGIGVHGEEGRGTCDKWGVKPDLLLVTFGKALGCSGAALLSSKKVADYFVQTSRPLIYSTALPPAQAHAIMQLIRVVRRDDTLRKTLQENIGFFRQKVANLGINTHSFSAIQPILIGDDHTCLTAAAKLKERNILVGAIRSPTVPPNGARLRISLSALHTFDDIKRLVEALSHLLK